MPCQTNFTSVFRFEEHRKSKDHAEKAGEVWKDPGKAGEEWQDPGKAAETPAAASAATSDGEGGGKGEQRFMPRRKTRQLSRKAVAVAEKRVFISNIPFETKEQDVKDLFEEQIGPVSYVNLFKDEDGQPRGCGIVEFEHWGNAKKAVEKMRRHDFKERKLVVKEDFEDVERDKFGKIIPANRKRKNSGGGGGGGGGGSGGTYDEQVRGTSHARPVSD